MLKNFVDKLLSSKDDDITYVSIDEKGRRINVNSLDPADYAKGVIDSFYSMISFILAAIFEYCSSLEENLDVTSLSITISLLSVIASPLTSRL